MSGEIRQLTRQTVIYGIGVALTKLTGFIMLPIYTRLLTPADYGVLELLTMTVEIISLITAAGLSAAVFKFYADETTAEGKAKVVSSAWIATISTGLLAMLAGVALSRWVTDLVFGKGEPVEYFRLFFLIFFVNRLTDVPFILLRLRHQSVAFVSVGLAKLVLMLSLNIYFVVYERRGVEGVLYANLIAGVLVGLALAGYFLRSVGWQYSRATLNAMLRFSWPFIFSALGSFVILNSDRYFVNEYTGTSAVGIYSLAYRFVAIMTSLAYVPFSQVWEPLRFELIKRSDAPGTFGKVFTYENCLLIGVGALVSIGVMDVIRLIAAPSFAAGYRPVAILVGATVMFHWGAFVNIGVLHRHRTHLMAWLSIYNVAVVLALNWALIPRWGYMGAAWATLGAYGLRYVALHIVSQRLYHIDYEWGRIFRLAAMFVVLSLARVAIGQVPIALAIAWDAGLMALVPIFMWTVVLHPEEREAAKQILSGRLALLRQWSGARISIGR